MKNKLSDLNDHLFAQMERLSEENITEEVLDKEIKRTKAINSTAREMINNGRLILHAHKAAADGVIKKAPGMMSLEDNS
jgi:hypothetical protein